MRSRRGEGRRRRLSRRVPQRTERVEITSIAAGGEGVGRLADGRAAFVHRTAPGELVDIAVMAEHPRWARARLLQLVRPAPERREAPCEHYADCGGCTLEHLTYSAQLRAKARIVADALERIGGIQVDPPPIVPSPVELRYRNRVTFTFRRLGPGSVDAGFHALHDPSRIVPIDGSCLLPEGPIGPVWDGLRVAWGPDAVLLPAGKRLRLTLRATATGSVSLLVEGGLSRGRPDELITRVPGLDAIWHRRGNERAEHVAGAPGLPELWGAETFELGGSVFLQVNRSAAAPLEDHILDTANPAAGSTVVDAYCGIGLPTRRLAASGARVIGIELDPDALAVAEAAGSDEAHFLLGMVEERLAAVLPADLVILNPPRAGISEAVTKIVLDEPPERIIYISCDPATLARDLKRLSESYTLRAIRCFDLFPQTAHVETVVELVRSSPTLRS